MPSAGTDAATSPAADRPPQPAIRAARGEDAEAIRVLVRDAYAPYVQRMGREPEPMRDDYDALVAAGEVWVAEGRDGLAGVLVLHVEPDHLLVANLAVARQRQRRGLGKTMLSFAEDHARALGLAEVRLYTHASMTENLAYYPRRGYRETHRTDQHGYARVFFSKSVSG